MASLKLNNGEAVDNSYNSLPCLTWHGLIEADMTVGVSQALSAFHALQGMASLKLDEPTVPGKE